MATADLLYGINGLKVQALQVPLGGLAYYANNKYFYLKLFQSINVRVTGPYVKKLSITKDGCKAYFSIFQHFMDNNAVNRSN